MNDIEKAVEGLRASIRDGINITKEPANDNRVQNESPVLQRVDIALEHSNKSFDAENAQVTSNQQAHDLAPIDMTKEGIRSAGQQEAGAGPVCNIPLNRLQTQGFITPKIKKGKLTEEYRRIKRPLMKNLRKEKAVHGLKNVIAVTSALSGEGKTYSAVNLAMSMAIEKERTVLLVDADVVKGAAGKLFSVARDQPGLTDVLYDEELDIGNVIMQTNVPSMKFISSGTTTLNTSELLSSNAMSELVIELARRYDDRIIILDCPPLLQTNEAGILAEHAGQVVFVVAEEKTNQKLVLSALEQIDEAKYVGILLNKSSSRVGSYDYYRDVY